MILERSIFLCRLMTCVVALVSFGEAAAQDDDSVDISKKAAAPPALRSLLRSCPRLEGQLTAELSQLQGAEVELKPGWWSSAEIRPGEGAIELREEDGHGADYRFVRLPSCSVLGFSWRFSYAGGYHLTPQVHPAFFLNGRRVGWHALEKDERAILLKGMRARLGSPDAMTVAGHFYRQSQREPSPQSPDVTQDGSRPLNDSIRRTKLEGHLPGKPRSEARTFTPCTTDAPRCGVPATGALFFGTRITKLRHSDGMDLYRLAFEAASKEEQRPPRLSQLARVHTSGDKLVIHDLQRDVYGFLFEGTGTVEVESTRLPGRDAFRLKLLSGSFPVFEAHHFLLDLENSFLYELPIHSSDDRVEPALLEENARCHVSCDRDGSCRAVNFAQVLESAGQAGFESVSVAQVPGLGERCESPGVILMSYLLARSDDTARSALQSLGRLPGWEDPPMRSAVRRAGTEQQGLFRVADADDSAPGHWSPYAVLGMRGGQAILLVSRGGKIPEDLVTGRTSFGAAIAVPRDSLLSMQDAERLSRLEQAIAKAEVCTGGEEGGCESLVGTVFQALCQPRLPQQQRQRICRAQRELLPEHQPWELIEVLKANCDGDSSWDFPPASYCGEERGTPGRKTFWCNRWKTLCPPQGG